MAASRARGRWFMRTSYNATARLLERDDASLVNIAVRWIAAAILRPSNPPLPLCFRTNCTARTSAARAGFRGPMARSAARRFLSRRRSSPHHSQHGIHALANHRKAIGVELSGYAERVRDIETAAVTVGLRARGVDLDAYPPIVVSMLIAQIPRSLCNEDAVGVTLGHDEMVRFVEQQIDAQTTSP